MSLPKGAVWFALVSILFCVLQSKVAEGNGINCYSEPVGLNSVNWVRCPDKWTCYSKRLINSEATAVITKGCAKDVADRKMECSWAGTDSNTATQTCYCNTNLCNTNSAGKNSHAGIIGAVIAAFAIYRTGSY